MGDSCDFGAMSDDLVAVLESASRLLEEVSDATLVGGSAAALYANHRYGLGDDARTLSEIDRYYTDPAKDGTPVADQIARQLSNVRPKDSSTIPQLARYKDIRAPWNNWDNVKSVLLDVAARMERKDYT